MHHPAPERLEAYVEDSLAAAERAVVESHLLTCARCQAVAEEWQTLFAELSSLPRPAPSPGFADRVMAGVRVPQPWYTRAAAWLGRLMPATTRGWAIAAAAIAAPVLTVAGAVAWVLSRPWISAQGLWLFVRDRTAEVAVGVTGWLGDLLLENTVALWVGEHGRSVLEGAGLPGIGLGLALLLGLTTLSAWIIYRNVVRTPTRDVHYASYCF